MSPMTPAVAGPQWMPTRRFSLRPSERRLAIDVFQHSQPESRNCDPPLHGGAVEAGRCHIAVANRLYFFDAVLLAQHVETTHQRSK